MLVDRDGNFWIGGGAGLHLLKRQQAFALGQAEGLGPGGVGSLVEVAPGVIWGVQPGRGLLSWERDSFRRLTAAGLTPTDPALGALLVTKDGACWVACEKGLLLFRDPQAASDESRLFEFPNGGITALAESPMGGIWAGTRQGELWQLQRGCWRLETQLSPARPISALASEPDGSVWVGTDGGGLLLVNGIVRAQYDRKRGLLSDVVRALHRDRSGTLWLGTEGGGLTRLSSEATVNFTTTVGLPDNDVYGILEAEDGNLWLNDGAGLNCIAKPSASASAVEVRGVFALASGQGNASAADPPDSRLFPHPCNGRDGHLWFPARRGIFVAEPFGLTPPANAPIVILEEVLVNGIPNLAFKPLAPAGGAPSLEHLRIGPGNHRLEVHFTCPQFTAPEKLRFRYRMVGLEPDWLEAGASRVAQYNYLPPGDYEFRVTMAGVEGPGTQAALTLTVAPHFWQRAWVISSGSLGLLAAMGGVVRFAENRRMKRRVRRLEEENALERERTRIAQDLHDEMGAKLCRISFLSEHAGRLDPASGEMKKQVSAIARDSRELLHSLDEIVWVVNPKNDTLEHLASYLGQYAQYYFQGTGVACELGIAQDLPDAPISSQARHHLFLAVHEALTNALKHSGATCIKLALSCESATLKIQVHDNGCGLDSCVSPGNHSATKAAGSGNGMLNMRQRLAAVGGQCDCRSAPGQGTTIEFILPLESSRFLKPQL
jgi:signal transduction histidine kinase